MLHSTKKNLRFSVPEIEGNLAGLWNTPITALGKHQAVSTTCFCTSSNYHVLRLRPSRDQRSVPDESSSSFLDDPGRSGKDEYWNHRDPWYALSGF